MLSMPVGVNLVTFFEDVGPEAYQWATGLPFSAISLDFTRGDSLKLLKDHGFPKDKVRNGPAPTTCRRKVVQLIRTFAKHGCVGVSPNRPQSKAIWMHDDIPT